MQYDVYRNPVAAARRAFPYVVVLQHDLAEAGPDRVIAFLAPFAAMPAAPGRLLPTVDVGSERFRLLVPSLTNVPLKALGAVVGNIAEEREKIVRAIDWLFLGV